MPSSPLSRPVAKGDTLSLRLRQPRAHQDTASKSGSALASPSTPLIRVLYEDDHLACVDKPRGLTTRGSGATSGARLEPLLPAALKPSALPGALGRPTPAHRLDAATGGLVVVAKTHAALGALGGAFAARTVGKRYLALVWGELQGRGRVSYPLDGREAVTDYRAGPSTAGAVVVAGPKRDQAGDQPAPDRIAVSTVSLEPHTGRTHQIRRHLALIGHPIVGDPRYSSGYAAQRAAALGQSMAEYEMGAICWEGQPSETGTGPSSRVIAPACIRQALESVPELGSGLHLWSVCLAVQHPAEDARPLDFQLETPPEIARAHAALRDWIERE